MPASKILVVDDSPTQLRRTTDLLEDAGYVVSTASDGEEAIERARNESPDAIVLDIILPKKNGYQVCRQLKTEPTHSGIKVLLVSSKNHDGDRLWGAKQGADAYVTKPFDDGELLDALSDLLRA